MPMMGASWDLMLMSWCVHGIFFELEVMKVDDIYK